jgi:AGZA family xanthine/uracil permease-like MFS transporter
MTGFTRRDVDGFFGLFIDNLVQIVLIMGFSLYVLGMKGEPAFLTRTVLPGVAVSVIAGNLFYAWQAMRLARREGRDDVTALPYGINTVSLFAYVFLVMLPVFSETGDFKAAWRVGLAACFFSGVIEFSGAFVARAVRAFLPRAALLSTLAGIAISFIALDFANRIFAYPLVALLPLVLIFMQYFGKVRFAFGLPGGLLSVAVGTALYWALGYGDRAALGAAFSGFSLSFNLPAYCGGELFSSLGLAWKYMGIIVPMGLFNLIGSLQNLESAAAGGDSFDERSSLMVNGLGTILAALLGSPYPTTIYIGHPGWKSLGARAGYSALNGVVIQALVLFGFTSLITALVPIEAGAPIVLWIGMIIFVQAFDAVPKPHYPAVIMGLIPSIGALAWLILSSAFAVAGTNYARIADWTPFAYAHRAAGFIALERGFILSSMLWSTLTVFIVERRFRGAALTALVLALFSWVGIIHTYRIGEQGQLFHRFVDGRLWQEQWQFAAAYAIIALFFLCVHARQRAPSRE